MEENTKRNDRRPRDNSHHIKKLLVLGGFMLLGAAFMYLLIGLPELVDKDYALITSSRTDYYVTALNWCSTRNGVYEYSWHDFNMMIDYPRGMMSAYPNQTKHFYEGMICCNYPRFNVSVCVQEIDVFTDKTKRLA